MPHTSRGLVLALAALTVGGLLAAQRAPSRPRLPGGARADTNDWQAYYDYGADVLRALPSRADSAFYWASRLDPSRAEPHFGRWVAFWLQDLSRFQDWLEGRRTTLESPAVLRADSLFLHALRRNPFVPQNLGVLPYDALPGRWRQDLGTQAWLAYAAGSYQRALDLLARLIARDPERYAWARFDRALAFVPMRHYDSAAVEMRALLATLRQRDTTGTTQVVYRSKEVVEYGIGLLALAQGDRPGARAAFERALEENLAFYPAHVRLGDLALDRRDGGTAATEYALAGELAPPDGWVHYRYGVVLVNLGRRADALSELRRAIELEPYFADPYLILGGVLDAEGDHAGAIAALEEFVRRAPRRATGQIADAERRLTALRTGPE